MDQNQNTSLFQLNIDSNTNYTLKSAATWGRLLGILGIIFAALFIIIGFMLQSAVDRTSDLYGSSYRSEMGLFATGAMVIYIIFGILTLIGSIFALNFGNKIATALRTNDQNSLRGGFAAVRNYFAFWSILMIIALLFVVLGMLNGGINRM